MIMLKIQNSILGCYRRSIEEFTQTRIPPRSFCTIFIGIFHLDAEIEHLEQFKTLIGDPYKGIPGIFSDEEPWGYISRLMTTCNQFCEDPNCGHGKSTLCVKEPELRETAEKTLAVLKKCLGHTD